MLAPAQDGAFGAHSQGCTIGVQGTIALFCILLPIVYFIPGTDGEGLHEDSLESSTWCVACLIRPCKLPDLNRLCCAAFKTPGTWVGM